MPKGKRKSAPKTGRPTVLADKDKKKILEVLGDGGSRRLAAAVVGVHHGTIANEAARDADFFAALKKAEAGCEHGHLVRIKTGDRGWQSSAWFLERKWPARYGRRDVPPVKSDEPEQINVRAVNRVLAARRSPAEPETPAAAPVADAADPGISRTA